MPAKLSLRGAYRAMVCVVIALAMAFGLAVAAPNKAQAANRDWLRPDATGECEWDPVWYWVQRCDVWSPSMQQNIAVQIQPSIRGGNAGLYMLDGLRARDWTSGWVHDVNAAATYVDSNITLVMPIGGIASFYTDWERPAKFASADKVIYKWETFLTSELPAYLQQNFGVSPNNNAIMGLSMGATSAMTLAGNHNDQFRQVLSLSGYLTLSVPGAYTFLRLALLDAGGFNVNAMYGSMLAPRRFANDPFLNLDKYRNLNVYLSAGSGVPAPEDMNMEPVGRTVGTMLEVMSNISTRAWESVADFQGVKYTAHHPAQGIHNWNIWSKELESTKPMILDTMNAW